MVFRNLRIRWKQWRCPHYRVETSVWGVDRTVHVRGDCLDCGKIVGAQCSPTSDETHEMLRRLSNDRDLFIWWTAQGGLIESRKVSSSEEGEGRRGNADTRET